MTGKTADLTRCRHIPDHHQAIGRSGQDRAAVRAEFHVVDLELQTLEFAKWLTGLDLAYRAAALTIAAGAENLFDVLPDRNITVNSFNGIQTFPSHSPFGMNGRTLYLRLVRTF